MSTNPNSFYILKFWIFFGIFENRNIKCGKEKNDGKINDRKIKINKKINNLNCLIKNINNPRQHYLNLVNQNSPK